MAGTHGDLIEIIVSSIKRQCVSNNVDNMQIFFEELSISIDETLHTALHESLEHLAKVADTPKHWTNATSIFSRCPSSFREEVCFSLFPNGPFLFCLMLFFLRAFFALSTSVDLQPVA
jgi:hypothetical protein